MVPDTNVYDKKLMIALWLCTRAPASSINRSDHHDITEILLKVVIKLIIHRKPYCYIK